MCQDLEKKTEVKPSFLTDIIPRSKTMTCKTIHNWLEWMSMDGLQNHEGSVCTYHEFVHKSEVDPPHCNT